MQTFFPEKKCKKQGATVLVAPCSDLVKNSLHEHRKRNSKLT